ncbi:MAG: hypothetical protein AB1762_07380 [Gemmatimonadota bacterium]
MIACPHSRMHRAAVAAAALFGLLTLFAGGRVLLGLGEVGYVVVRPVLVFNTVMGAVYITVALLAVRDLAIGRRAALVVVLLNAAVLTAVLFLRFGGSNVATETLGAMVFRTILWTTIALMLYRASRVSTSSAD